ELEVEGKLLGGGRSAQADADLTVGDLACRAGVLPLHADGVLSLFEKACVVDDPGGDGLATSEFFEGVAGSFSTHGEVVPDAPPQEVAELAVQIVSFARVSPQASGDGLGALAVAVAEQAHCVEGEGLAAPLVLQVPSEPTEVVVQTCCHLDFRGIWGQDPAHLTKLATWTTFLTVVLGPAQE